MAYCRCGATEAILDDALDLSVPDRRVRIGAYYDDEYVKVDGQWKIRSIGYSTIFHEEWKRDELPSLRIVKV